jgi:hypothetical protein
MFHCRFETSGPGDRSQEAKEKWKMEPGSAVVLMLVLITSAVGIIVWSLSLRYRRRELEHKERLAALDKGMPLPVLPPIEARAPWTPRIYLLRGLIWLFSGLALTPFLAAVSLTSQQPRSIEDRVREASWLKQAGATDEQVRDVWHDNSPRVGMPIGVALIGLVPMGVGAAYLIFYRAERQAAA